MSLKPPLLCRLPAQNAHAERRLQDERVDIIVWGGGRCHVIGGVV